MAKSATIGLILYWYSGLPGWTQLIIGEVPVISSGTSVYLAVGWVNTGTESITGRLRLTVTKPDGTQKELSATANQDKAAAPGGGWTVQFEPITLDQAGMFKATAILTDVGTGVQLASISFNFAYAVVSYVYADIVSVEAPSVGVPGSKTDLVVNVKNTYSSTIGIMVSGSVLVGGVEVGVVTFPVSVDNVGAGQTRSFQGYFTMPSGSAKVHLISYYWGADGQWHFSDEYDVIVSVDVTKPTISSFGIIDFAKA